MKSLCRREEGEAEEQRFEADFRENGSRLTCDEVAKRDFLSTNQSKRNNNYVTFDKSFLVVDTNKALC